MLSFLRAQPPPRINRASQNPIVYENGRSSVSFYASHENYVFRTTLPPRDSDISIMEPPFHYHIHQTETFRIVTGSMNLYKGVDPKPWKQLTATTTTTDDDDAENHQPTATIPPKTYHRLQNASATEELVFDVRLSPAEYEVEERFFRNFFGYLDDCKIAQQAPSLFQLMVFLHAADIPLALPTPWHGLGVIESRVFTIVVAAWGRWVLGYQISYPEYYQGKKGL